MQRARSVPHGATIADVIALGELRHAIPVLGPGDVVIGAVQPTARALPPDTVVDEVMTPAPGTIRPELRIDEVAQRLRDDGLDHVLVTSVDGRLIGIVLAEDLHV